MSNASGPSARATCSVRPSSRLTPEAHVGRAHDRGAAGGIAHRLLLLCAQAGRADHVAGAACGGERDVRDGRSGRGELDHDVGALDQGRRVGTHDHAQRAVACEQAEVLAERRMVVAVDATDQRAVLGGEHLADHRPAHPAGAPQNADPHARLPPLAARGSMRAPVLLSRQARQAGQFSCPSAWRNCLTSMRRASTSAAVRPAAARRDGTASPVPACASSSVLNSSGSFENSCASCGPARSAAQISSAMSLPHCSPEGSRS